MDFRRLRYFVAIVDAGSVSKASAQVRIAQPALSQQLLTLETEVGARLVDRTSHGITTTSAGRRLYRHALTILRQVEEARRHTRDDTDDIDGVVSVALPTSVATILALPLLDAVRTRYPGIHLHLIEAFSGHIMELTNNNRVDLSVLFTDTPGKGITARQILSQKLYLISKQSGDDGQQTTISMRDMKARKMVLPSPSHSLRSLIDQSFARLGIELNVVSDVDSLPLLRTMAERGIADTILPICVLSRGADAQHLSAQQLTGPGINRPISICVPEGLPPSPAAALVSDVLVETVGTLVNQGIWAGAHLV
jgi:LysR family nitrogen assimilation transcriptional regulator